MQLNSLGIRLLAIVSVCLPVARQYAFDDGRLQSEVNLQEWNWVLPTSPQTR
jgi:hypothetical protein